MTANSMQLFEGGGSLMADFDRLASNLEEVAQQTVGVNFQPLLRLQKDGSWIFGQDDQAVTPGSLWAINPASVQRGYAAWTIYPPPAKNQLLEERMAPLGQPKPDLRTLPDLSVPNVPAPWTEQISVQLRAMTGEEAGQQVLYKTNSKGGLRAMSRLIDLLIERLREGKHGGKVVPIVQLGNDSYPHPSYGKTYVPIIEIVDWTGFDGGLPAGMLGSKPAGAPRQPTRLDPYMNEARPAQSPMPETPDIGRQQAPRQAPWGPDAQAEAQAQRDPPPWTAAAGPQQSPGSRIRRRRV